MSTLHKSSAGAPRTSTEESKRLTAAGGVGLLGSALAFSCIFLLGGGLVGDSGADVTAALVDEAIRLQLTAITAMFAAVALCVAAVRLGRRIGGDAGSTATVAGVAVSLLMSAYYSVPAAGALVADLLLNDPGPGVGEASLVLLNVVEVTRYAPSLLLVAAVLVARRRLPKAITVSAGLLAVLTVFPMTSWIAAVLIPIWLGVCAVGRHR